MILGTNRTHRATAFAMGNPLGASGGGGTPPGVIENAGTAFGYAEDETGATNSNSAYSAKGNVAKPSERLRITHMRAHTQSAVTGDFILARVSAVNGEILEFLSRVNDTLTTSGGWTEVELPEPVIVYPDVEYLLLFDRTDGGGGTSSTISYVSGWTGTKQNLVTGWRNNNEDSVLGDFNEAPIGAEWVVDWRGDTFGELIYMNNDWNSINAEAPVGVAGALYGTGPTASTAQTIIGTNSMFFSTDGGITVTGSGDTASVANADDFTFEAFVYQTSHAAQQTLFCKRDAASAEEFAVYITPAGLLEFATLRAGNVNENVFTDAALPLNEWAHVAVVRKGRQLRIYVKGVLQADVATETATPSANGQEFSIGFDRRDAGRPLVGYLGPTRITMHVALYDEDFTPTTVAFGDVTVEEEESGLVTAKRWRLLTRNRPSNGYIWIEELKLTVRGGGTQAAVDGTTGTASASSQSGAAYSADGAFDGDYAGNGWSSAQFASAQENWLEFEFDTATTVTDFEIHARTPSAYAPADFDIQYHDGTDWVVAATFDIESTDYDVDNSYAGNIQ